MALTSAQIDDFSKYARDPKTWVLASRRSLAVARLLMNRSRELMRVSNSDFFEFSGCHYAGYFHAAMAVENALKAVLVSRDPSIVVEGRLDVKKFGGKSGHALLAPLNSILDSLTEEERCLVVKLEEHIWAGRYTVPTKADVLYDQERMDIMRTSTFEEAQMLESLVDRTIACIAG